MSIINQVQMSTISSLMFCVLGMVQVSGRNLRALVMKDWDQFHQSGKASVKMMVIPAFTATGILTLFNLF